MNVKDDYTCTKCKITQTVNDFRINNKIKRGYDYHCKKCQSIIAKENHLKNREHILLKKKEWRNLNKEKCSKDAKEWSNLNKEKIIIDNANYYKKNKIILQEKNKKYILDRRNTDPLFRLSGNIRSLIFRSFKNNFIRKNTKTATILGCSFEEFKIYLEKQFTSEMNWDNQGSYWHMDHIKPVSLATNENELILLNHYTNFQPLEKTENIKKGNKYGC